jgi:putative membrane protein
VETKDSTVVTEKKMYRNPSRVRDHLANERTYLAWMRTAVSLMGFGIVIVRLRYLIPPQVPRTGQGWKLGLLFTSIGLLTVLLSTLHYFAIRHAVDDDTYEPTGWWVIAFSLAVTIIGLGVLYVLFAAPQSDLSGVLSD